MQTMNGKTSSVELIKDKDCKGSVRFKLAADAINAATAPVDNVYVSRAMDGINAAKRVRVTVEVIE